MTSEAFGDKVEWRESPEPFTGVHFSNELLDAMPVRLIRGGMEKLVALDGDKFVFVERPVDKTMFIHAALECVDQIAANLQRGYVIAIDYGFSDEEFERTVEVRARHRNLDSPFEQIGDADITMSVHWRSIVERAQANGLRVAGFTDQHHFLTGIISTWPDLVCSSSPPDIERKTKRALQTLLHPEMLGRAFQVLALAKDVDRGTPRLTGFKFSRGAQNLA
jgi:SAM-dependent MidA family methyltransferase